MAATHYFWHPLSDNIIEEFDDAGATIATYTTEPGLYGNVISQNRADSGSRFLQPDAIGSVRAVTDETGAVSDTNTFSAYSETIQFSGTSKCPFGYIGRIGYFTDGQSEHVNVRERIYRPLIARWISSDPIAEVYYVHHFSYTRNKPLKQVDPSGLMDVAVNKLGATYTYQHYCGGYGAQFTFTAHSKKPAKEFDNVVYVQRLCLYSSSSLQCCRYGAPPDYSCECGFEPLQKVKLACCIYEFLGVGVRVDERLGIYEPAVDTHVVSPLSNLDCGSVASRGNFYVTATIRAFGADIKILKDVLAWSGNRFGACDPGLKVCGELPKFPRALQTSGGIAIRPGTKPPIWWDGKWLADEAHTAVRVNWDCCNKPQRSKIEIQKGDWKDGTWTGTTIDIEDESVAPW